MMFKKLINLIGILLSGFFSLIGFFEFYKVGIKKETESYPFGGEGSVPYFYRTAELYSNVNLAYGIIFGLLFVIGILSLRQKKIYGVVILILTLFLILLQLYHSKY